MTVFNSSAFFVTDHKPYGSLLALVGSPTDKVTAARLSAPA